MAKPPQEPRVAEVAGLVHAIAPEIPVERLVEIVAEVAPVPLTQRRLELALLKQPGVLWTCRSDASQDADRRSPLLAL